MGNCDKNQKEVVKTRKSRGSFALFFEVFQMKLKGKIFNSPFPIVKHVFYREKRHKRTNFLIRVNFPS